MTIPDSVKQLDGYMFDTTEFNAVATRELRLSAISGQRLFATHVQLDEIDKTLRANACTTLCGVRGDCCRELAPGELGVGC